jgi:glycosyltransferase involved in cell wall biosynthesis
VKRAALLVDGRVLDDRQPGVHRFWTPILAGWAGRGGRGLLAHQKGSAPVEALLAAGFEAVELARGARDPRGFRHARRIVRTTGVPTTLSPLYLTLDGAPRNLATVFDLTGRTHPRSLGSRLVWEAAMWRTRRRALTVITASSAAERELRTHFPGLGGRTAIVPPVAPDSPRRDRELLARADLEPPFVLAVASHRPHKRLAELVRAWHAAATGIPLVLAGQGTCSLDDPPRVRGLGFVSDATLAALLADAGCLVSASASEGFGLTVLAAMTAGVPVAATRLPAHEELAGDAALWADVDDLDRLAELAASAASDPSRVTDRIERGTTRAREFSVEKAARALARLVEAGQ